MSDLVDKVEKVKFRYGASKLTIVNNTNHDLSTIKEDLYDYMLTGEIDQELSETFYFRLLQFSDEIRITVNTFTVYAEEDESMEMGIEDKLDMLYPETAEQ